MRSPELNLSTLVSDSVTQERCRMKTFLLIFVIITKNVVDSKEVLDINIGAFFHEANTQLHVPLNNMMHKNNYERRNIRLNVSTEIIPGDDPFKSSKAFCNLVEKIPNLIAVFVSESAGVSPIVQSISSKLNLPYIQTNWHQSSSFIGSETALNFYPEFDLLAQGLAKLVESLHWRSFTVLYEDFNGFQRIQEILKLQKFEDKNRNNIFVKKLNFEGDIRSLLKQIRQSGEHRIILDCDTARIVEVLEKAKSVGIMTFAYSYFLTNLDAHTLDFKSLKVDANITTARIMNPENDEFQKIVSSWKYNELLYNFDAYEVKTETMLIHESINLLMEAVNDIYQDENIKFNNISCKSGEKFNQGSAIISYINSHYMRSAPTGNLSFSNTGRRKNFTLYLIEGNRNEIIASWDSVNPETVNVVRTEEEMTKKRQETLQSGKTKIASRIEKPYLMYKKGHEQLTGNDRFEGYAMDLMIHIAAILNNFTFEFHIPEDNQNGIYNPITQTWTGIIGEIVNDDALFGLGDMTITADRETAVDFSMPYMRLGIGILLQKPQTSVDMFAFLNPLSAEVWMYTVTLYLTVSVILYFVARMAPGDWENPHPCNLTPNELENLWSISNCLWLTMGSIMNQGSDILPKGVSSRLVTSMWWFFALIITNSYIASLAAFLTSKGSIIDDLEDLAKQNKIKYGTLQDGSTQEFFRQSNYSTYRRMYANMMLSKPSVFVKTSTEGVRRVISTKDGMYAFLMESSTIDYLIERNCKLASVDKWFNNIEYGIAMPLDCPYRSDINDAILKLQEQGTLTDLKNKWWRDQDRSEPCPSVHKGAELKLANVGGIFVVLGIGVGVALLLGILEFFWTVRRTSIEEHISYWEAFKIELMFSLKVWVSQKKAQPQSTDSNDISLSKENENHTWPN